MALTTDPNDPGLGHGSDSEPKEQEATYLVLSEEERAKGFVRPVRHNYFHVECSSPVPGKAGLPTLTTMATPIAETYARNPKFYGATYCCACRMHRPVSEFRWADERTGEITNEVLGS